MNTPIDRPGADSPVLAGPVEVGPVDHPLTAYRLLIFDVDGTLRRCTVPGQPCPNAPGQWELLPRVRNTLACYDWARCDWALVSNQGGVALGFLPYAVAWSLLLDTARAAFALPEDTVTTLDLARHVFWCPHAPQAGCLCRKPSPLLLLQAACPWGGGGSRAPRYTRREVLYVGDLARDREAAARAGVAFCFAETFFGWQEVADA